MAKNWKIQPDNAMDPLSIWALSGTNYHYEKKKNKMKKKAIFLEVLY